MIKSKKILIILAAIIIVGILWFSLAGNKSDNLVNPQIPAPFETPSPDPTPTVPKTFNFDSQTDLQAEWEKVNPQVLDSDFE